MSPKTRPGELKVLVVYYSATGNTEKAAGAIRRGLEREGVKPIVKKTSEAEVDGLQNYDLILIGSGVGHWMPPKPMQDWTWKGLQACGPAHIGERIPGKNGVVFITYSGPHTGINEAIPAGKYLGCFLEHIGFAVREEWYTIGEFHGDRVEWRTRGRLGDTTGRPNERDLAELEDKAANLARWTLLEINNLR